MQYINSIELFDDQKKIRDKINDEIYKAVLEAAGESANKYLMSLDESENIPLDMFNKKVMNEAVILDCKEKLLRAIKILPPSKLNEKKSITEFICNMANKIEIVSHRLLKLDMVSDSDRYSEISKELYISCSHEKPLDKSTKLQKIIANDSPILAHKLSIDTLEERKASLKEYKRN